MSLSSLTGCVTRQAISARKCDGGEGEGEGREAVQQSYNELVMTSRRRKLTATAA